MTNREIQYKACVDAINRYNYGEGVDVPPPKGISRERWDAMFRHVMTGTFDAWSDLRTNWRIWRYDYNLPA